MRSISKEKGNLLWLSPPRPQQQWQQQKNQGHKQRQQEEKKEKNKKKKKKKKKEKNNEPPWFKKKTHTHTHVQTKKKHFFPTYPGITQLESIFHNQDTRLWVSKNLGQIGVGSPPEPPSDKNRG